MSPARISILTLCLALLGAAPSSALEVERTRHQLCAKADVVVIAEVTSFDTIWLEGAEGGLLTRVWFAAVMPVRGNTGEGAIELLLPGGAKDGVEHYVEDTPEKPTRDRRYLLFLKRGPNGSYKVIGGERGVVAIKDQAYSDGERHIDALASVSSCKQ